MPNFQEMLEHIEAAEREVNAATDAMVPLTAIRQVDAYVLGILMGSSVQLREARNAILQSADFKSKRRALKGDDGTDNSSA